MKNFASEELKVDLPIINQAFLFVFKLYKNSISSDYQYHSIDHIAEVAKATNQLCEQYKIKDREKEDLLLASLFYTTGISKSSENIPAASKDVFKAFAEENDLAEERIETVSELIDSTNKSQAPRGLYQEILHDAIISEVGRKRFFRRSELLRLERKKVYGEAYTQKEWEAKMQQYLMDHDFYTMAARKEYGSRRSKNIRKQRDNILKGDKISIRKKTGKDLGRGVDTLYRSAYRNHINLSSIADNKANMMISINTVILSVIVTLSGAGLSFTNSFIVEHLRFIVPIFVLLLSSLASVVFAVMSAKPDVSENEISSFNELDMEKNSLLYFGTFTGVDLENFKTYLQELKANQGLLYDAMSIDLFSLGVVLRKKYKLITISYNIFMIGLVLCVISFISIFIYTQFSQP